MTQIVNFVQKYILLFKNRHIILTNVFLFYYNKRACKTKIIILRGKNERNLH